MTATGLKRQTHHEGFFVQCTCIPTLTSYINLKAITRRCHQRDLSRTHSNLSDVINDPLPFS